ncbi:hypothetical protein P4O66_010913 [Electrophorus voltai]|uniref:Dynamin-binding protein n=1 Tax=Electrophorus voltai TaxID=2609070 RepID=A0AAD8Z9Q6_9TELE|nr:hypothetical protein P4O66_010913 [Electrophorus voltai]
MGEKRRGIRKETREPGEGVQGLQGWGIDVQAARQQMCACSYSLVQPSCSLLLFRFMISVLFFVLALWPSINVPHLSCFLLSSCSVAPAAGQWLDHGSDPHPSLPVARSRQLRHRPRMEAGSLVHAVFEFLPSVSEELPLFAGDIVEVLSVVDEFWLLGVKDGVTGQFPSTFVESVTIPPTKPGEQLYVCISHFTSSESGHLPLKRGDVVAGEGRVHVAWQRGRNAWGSRGLFPTSCVKEMELSCRSRQLSERSAAAQASELPPHALGRARALMGLRAQLDEELDFREGDIITIVAVPEPGWFQGELDGRTGVFPEGFVELLTPLRSPQEETEPPSMDQYHQLGKEEEEQSVQEGEQEQEGVKHDTETETQHQEEEEEEEEEEGSMYGTALYEFRALEPGELDFDVGDRIRIFGTLEDGWLEGQLRGKRGIFPHRFVKMDMQLQAVPHLPVGNKEVRHPEKQQGHSFPAECTSGQRDRTVPEYEQECVTHEDHTVWDLDYFERREKSKETRVRDAQSKAGSQDRAEAWSQPRPQLGPRRRERPPPPLTQPSRTRHSFQRADSGRPAPARPQLPPRPSFHILGSRRHSASSRRSLPAGVPVPSARTQSLKQPGRTTAGSQSRSSWTRNNRQYASHDGGHPFTTRVLAGQEETSHCASVGDANLSSSESGERRVWSQGQTNGLSASQTLDSLAMSTGNLEDKLSQQLLEFERSLPGCARGGEDQGRTEEFGVDWENKATRHFSILDYSSENDIIRGSSHSPLGHLLPPGPSPSDATSSLERRKTLRPPPPRPKILKPLVGRPRRHPRPPPPCPRPSPDAPARPSTQNPNLLFSTEPEEVVQEDELKEAEDVLEMERERERDQEQYGLLLRLEEVERDIDVYTRTAQELRAILEEEGEEEEEVRQQSLDNLALCTYTVEILTLEQQQLRGNLMPFLHVSLTELWWIAGSGRVTQPGERISLLCLRPGSRVRVFTAPGSKAERKGGGWRALRATEGGGEVMEREGGEKLKERNERGGFVRPWMGTVSTVAANTGIRGEAEILAGRMKGQVALGHPIVFAPVAMDVYKAPPRRGKSVEELVSENRVRDRYAHMHMHFQQQLPLPQPQVVYPPDFMPVPGHVEKQAYPRQASGMRHPSWEYEDWDRVSYREGFSQQRSQYSYQTAEAVFRDPRRPQEWAGNRCFYEPREDVNYDDHRENTDYVPRTKESAKHMEWDRYDYWDAEDYYDERERYARRDRYAYTPDREERDYDDKERDGYRERDHYDKERDRYQERGYYDKERDRYQERDYGDKERDRYRERDHGDKERDRYRERDHYDKERDRYRERDHYDKERDRYRERDHYDKERDRYRERDHYDKERDRYRERGYYDKERESYRERNHYVYRDRDHCDHKELDKYERYDHKDSTQRDCYETRQKHRYGYQEGDSCDRREKDQYDRRQGDHSGQREDDRDHRKADRYAHREKEPNERRKADRYREKDMEDYRTVERCERRGTPDAEYPEKDHLLKDKGTYDYGKSDRHKPRDKVQYICRGRSPSDHPEDPCIQKDKDGVDGREKDHHPSQIADQYSYRDKESREHRTDDHCDSGVKDCFEDAQKTLKSTAHCRDVPKRAPFLDQEQEGYSSDQSSWRYSKEWEEDANHAQTVGDPGSWDGPGTLSHCDHEDGKNRAAVHPGLGRLEIEKQGQTHRLYVGSLDRNSVYRRTAPSSLRKCEFVVNRKQNQEMTASASKTLESAPTSAVTTEDPEQRMLEKRSKVIKELLQTEKDYIKDLTMCRTKIMEPMKSKQVQNIDFDGLFGNIESVTELSSRLYEALQDADSIGKVFLDFKSELEEVYKLYCQNHDDAISLLETYEKDETIQRQVQACLETLRGKTNYINLGSFLIKPVQRVMRYPLLLTELLNTTPVSHHDRKQLEDAVQSIKEINVNINEHKRRKDLVVKYRKGDEDRLIDKISKLSMHSIIKKSNRVSSHLKHLTGISPQIKDEAFDEAEKRFRLQERLIKSFIRDISLYLQHIRESASVKVLSAISFCDIYAEQHQDPEPFQQAHRLISERHFTLFKERTEALVISPLNQLLSMFAGPHKLIQKRFDKLLDYDSCKERADRLRERRVQDELQAARNNYEALNGQLLDELPKFHRAAEELLTGCARAFTQAQRDFIRRALEELTPLMQLPDAGGAEGNLVALFQEDHSRVLQLLQSFSFYPESLPTSRKPFDKRTLEKQSSKKPLHNPPSCMLQTNEHRAALLSRYDPDKLFQAERNFNAAQDLDISILEGDLVGVIKQQDPMGSQNRWLIDNGATKGFVYSSFLKPYNPRRSQSDVSIESHSSNESGYGGSSPVFSRQNSNSTLTFNQETSTVSFSIAAPPNMASTRPTQDSAPSHRNTNTDSASPNYPPTNQRDTLDSSYRNYSNHRELPEKAYCNTANLRDYSEPLYENLANYRDASDSTYTTPAQLGDLSDPSETESCSSNRDSSLESSQRYTTYGSQQRRNGEWSAQPRRPQYPADESTEPRPDPEPEQDGHQIYYALYSFNARCSNELSISANQRLRILEFQDMNGNQEWWLGEVEGRRGYVPSNYIRKSEYT